MDNVVAFPLVTEVPHLTVKSLARVMVLPAYAYATELRDQMFVRADKAKIRVHAYHRALSALRNYVRTRDVTVLEVAIAALEAELFKEENRDSTSKHRIRMLKANIRVMASFATFDRLRQVAGGTRPETVKITFSGVEIRATPEIHVTIEGTERRVFVHCSEDALDVDEARRTLELAHWLAEEAGLVVPMSQFEYWSLAENQAHCWKAPRKQTIDRAIKTLPMIAGAWDKIPEPKSRAEEQVVGDAG